MSHSGSWESRPPKRTEEMSPFTPRPFFSSTGYREFVLTPLNTRPSLCKVTTGDRISLWKYYET